MKTIGQAAEECANLEIQNTLNVKNTSVRSFKAGVEFAQRWRNFNEERPQEGETILVRSVENEYALATYNSEDGVNGRITVFATSKGYGAAENAWRPIELK